MKRETERGNVSMGKGVLMVAFSFFIHPERNHLDEWDRSRRPLCPTTAGCMPIFPHIS